MEKDIRSTLQKIYEMFEDNELDEWDRGYLEGFEFAMEMVKELYQIEPTEDECEAILFALAFAKEN